MYSIFKFYSIHHFHVRLFDNASILRMRVHVLTFTSNIILQYDESRRRAHKQHHSLRIKRHVSAMAMMTDYNDSLTMLLDGEKKTISTG